MSDDLAKALRLIDVAEQSAHAGERGAALSALRRYIERAGGKFRAPRGDAQMAAQFEHLRRASEMAGEIAGLEERLAEVMAQNELLARDARNHLKARHRIALLEDDKKQLEADIVSLMDEVSKLQLELNKKWWRRA